MSDDVKTKAIEEAQKRIVSILAFGVSDIEMDRKVKERLNSLYDAALREAEKIIIHLRNESVYITNNNVQAYINAAMLKLERLRDGEI